MYQLILSPEAQKDLEQATDYYKTISYLVTERFIKALESLYEKLKQSPQHYSFFDINKKLRSASLIRFPYSIIFHIQKDTVYVFAVFNTEQNPDKLFKRIK
jgi:plasmid stabilization system protein ParE